MKKNNFPHVLLATVVALAPFAAQAQAARPSAGWVRGWPDVIICRDNGQPHDQVTGLATGQSTTPAVFIYIATELPGHDGKFHYGPLAFNADGTPYSVRHQGFPWVSDCTGKSIVTLVGSGQARSFQSTMRLREAPFGTGL